MKRVLLIILPVTALAIVLLKAADSIYSPEAGSDSESLVNNYAAYAIFFGLNPTNLDEAGLDYDGDDLQNYGEYLKLADPFEPDTDRDGFNDRVDSNAVSRVYIRWGDPQFTTDDQYEYPRTDWCLGAYKVGGEWVVDTATTQSAWRVAADAEAGSGSLNIDLSREILTNNLRFAVRFEGRAGASRSAGLDPSLHLDLLDENGLPVVEDLYGNLFALGNYFDGGTRSVASVSNGGTTSTSSSASVETKELILNVPLTAYPSAAVLHLRHGQGEVLISENLLYISEDGDELDSDQEKQIGTSDYSVDTDGNGISDFDQYFNSTNGSSTNVPGGGSGGGSGGGGGDEPGGEEEDQKGKIFVDQGKGDDSFSGRLPNVAAGNKGPKKTCRSALSIAEPNDTIIIKSGNYNENLNISGKTGLKVIIAGNVRL